MCGLRNCVISHIFLGKVKSPSQLVQCFGGFVFVGCIASSTTLHMFRSGELAAQSSFSIKFGRFF